MRQILQCVLFCLMVGTAVAGSIDEPIAAGTFGDTIQRLKGIESQLNQDDALFFQIGFERLDVEVARHVANELSEPERQRLFVSVIDGLTPRKIILLGCMAYVRQTREALQLAKNDELPQRRMDVKRAEEILNQAVQKYARPQPGR